MISVGSSAPDFTLKDQNGQLFHLAEFTGKKILLSFHPLAWTKVCHDQMVSLEENFERINRGNTIPVGISTDSVPTKKAWADSMNLKNLRILADFWPHGAVAQLYGVFREKDGFSERANIIIGEKMEIIWAKSYPLSHLPEIEEIIGFLDTH